MWRRKDQLKKRIISGMLACLLVATSAGNSLGIITAFAGEIDANKQKVAYSYKEQNGVQLSVLPVNDSFAPGEKVKAKVYIQNNTGETLTGGELVWSGSGFAEAGFPKFGDWMDEEQEETIDEDEWLALLEELKATDSDAEEESDARRIWNIQLSPGEIFETEFVGIIDPELEKVKNRELKISFSADKENGGQVREIEEFSYNTGIATMLPVEFEGGNSLLTNEETTMYLRTNFNETELSNELSGPDFDSATSSDAKKATASDAEDDGVGPENLKYSIVTYGAKLKGVKAEYDEAASGQGTAVTNVSFRVEDGTEPGTYFGTVETSIRYNRKSYKTMQGFYFYVTGDGELVLKGKMGDAEIQVKGPVESFPEGDMLSLKVSEVPEEKQEMVQAAIAQKAEETGIAVNKLKAVDIKVICDGKEEELRDNVKVTFSNFELVPVGGQEEGTETQTEETTDGSEEAFVSDFEMIEMQEMNAANEAQPRMFSVRRMNEPVEAEITEEVEIENLGLDETTVNGEEKESEESTLAVWHLDEEAGIVNDMGGEVDENGDVVMTTNHFSVFILVDMEALNGQITLTVQHWANVKVLDGENGKEVLVTQGPNDIVGDGEAYLRYEEKLREIYSTDTIVLDNSLKRNAEELSKICLANANKPNGIKNYNLKAVWVLKAGKNPESEVAADWVSYPVDNTERVITLNSSNTIRMVYEPVETLVDNSKAKESLRKPVTFYDYNVVEMGEDGNPKTYTKSDVGTTTTATYYNTNNQGINSSENYSGGTKDTRIAVGLDGTGIFVGYGGTDYAGHVNRAKVTGMVKGLKPNGDPDYNGYYDAGLFNREPKIGKKVLDGYSLGFDQTGDTYVLSKVYKGTTQKLENLNKFREVYDKTPNWGARLPKNIYSNMFWPLDTEAYTGRDPLMGTGTDRGWNGVKSGSKTSLLPGNDDNDGKKHNCFFGMRYEFQFTVGDYTGPLNYYFRGDDDFWMFIDGELVVDIGGVGSSVGKMLNLRTEFFTGSKAITDANKNEPHDVTILYTERGGSGSSCYMEFTLPNVTSKTFDTEADTTDVTVIKKWDDNENPYRPTSIQVQLYYKKDGESDKNYVAYGNSVTLSAGNSWKYTWKELPEEGYVYKVEELTTNTAYEVTYKSGTKTDGELVKIDGSYSGTITNTLKPAVRVEVEKIWEDGNDRDKNRPLSVVMQLQYKLKGESTYHPFPGAAGILELSDADADTTETNMWSGSFEGLPAYIDGKEVSYRVRELNGKAVLDDGNKLPGKKGNDSEWSYTVKNDDHYETYPEYLNRVPGDDETIRLTTITNTYEPKTVGRKVTKKWEGISDNLNITATAKIGLYRKSGDDWILVEKNANDEELVNPGEVNWPIDAAVGYVLTWTELPKFGEDGNEVTYGIFEATGETNEPIIESGSKIVLNEYQYEVSFTDATAEEVTITNELRKAKLRVGKWIDNDKVSPDVLEDEFIITVKSGDGTPKFETGVVLNPAGYGSSNLDPSKLSKYIEVPVKATGSKYIIGEKTDLKEYTPSTPFVTLHSGTGEIKEHIITVMPGGDDIVLVHNKFKHNDYFHHDNSANNLFEGSKQSVNSENWPKADEMAKASAVSMNAFIGEEMGKERKRKPVEEDERLM